jgi:hypothetical protein
VTHGSFVWNELYTRDVEVGCKSVFRAGDVDLPLAQLLSSQRCFPSAQQKVANGWQQKQGQRC